MRLIELKRLVEGKDFYLKDIRNVSVDKQLKIKQNRLRKR